MTATISTLNGHEAHVIADRVMVEVDLDIEDPGGPGVYVSMTPHQARDLASALNLAANAVEANG